MDCDVCGESGPVGSVECGRCEGGVWREDGGGRVGRGCGHTNKHLRSSLEGRENVCVS